MAVHFNAFACQPKLFPFLIRKRQKCCWRSLGCGIVAS